MTPILEIKELSVGSLDRPRPVLENVTVTVGEGQTVVLIGSNGAGKTMFLKTLIGLIPPRAGSFVWRVGAKIGYVPQKFVLDKNLPITVGEFLSLKHERNTVAHKA